MLSSFLHRYDAAVSKRIYNIPLHYRNESATKSYMMTVLRHWKKCKHETFSLLYTLYKTMFILPTQIQWHLGITVKRLALLDNRMWRTWKQIRWKVFSVFLYQLPTFSFLLFHDQQNSRSCTVLNEEGILRMWGKPTETSGSLLVCETEVPSVSVRILHLN